VQAQHVIDVMPAFLIACVILAALPGPATALFLHRSIRDGRAAGLAAVAGNEIGIFAWTLASGAGLSVLLMAAIQLVIDTAWVRAWCWRRPGRKKC
jgi:threonine/homoserine/homoserine lactone efflux protein